MLKRKRRSFLFFVFTLMSFPLTLSAASWMDRSHTIFLPDSIQNPLSLQMEFPTFWWNFVIIENNNSQFHFESAHQFCNHLSTIPTGFVKKSACPEIAHLFPLIESWSQDIFKRQDAPDMATLKESLLQATTKASLPLGPDILRVLRNDPLETYKDLQNLLVKNVSLGFDKQNGFFVEPLSQRIIIPIQMNFAPQDTEAMRGFIKTLPQNASWSVVGPHISALENESQILKDVDTISWLGLVLMLAQLLFVVITRRLSYFWLIPPMVLGIAGAGILTYLFYGSIHGLTLSLGTGIIALSLDFGLHSVHNIQWKGVWRANLFGLLTTYAGLLAISLSAIPLLRQMMVFSALGLSLSYIFYFLLHRRFPKLVEVRAFRYSPRVHTLKTLTSLSFVIVGLMGSFALRPDLNMQQFDSQTKKTRQTLVWLYSHIHQRMPLFSVHKNTDDLFENSQREKQWAEINKIHHSNLSYYLPEPRAQALHQKTWWKHCSEWNRWTELEKKLFSPFLEKWPCTETLSPRLLSTPPLYMSDIVSPTHSLTTWFPENDEQIQKIKNYDTQALSLKETLETFPKILEQELLWMVPLSLVLCLLLLWLYFRKLILSLISLVPFLTGLGAYFACVFVFGWGYSFISIIGLIMVFGLSIDYGIFAANLYLLKEPPPREGVWTCLVLAAAVTILGFLPLTLCTHPVLVHLGQTLVMGSIGTWIGTVWGIPGIFSFLKTEAR